MNYRERMIPSVQFREVDELPFRHAYGLMPGVLEDWYDQGLPRSVQIPEEIYKFFGFQTKSEPLPVKTMFDPPFEGRVIEDTPELRIEIDGMGRRRYTRFGAKSI